MYSIRLVTADSYQAAPIPDVDPTFSHFRGSDIKQLPIVRIFGITDKGEKVCLHVHGAFPYLYVPYTGKIKTDILMYRLAASLDTAINVSLGAAKSNTQHVYKIQEVSAIPFYGYYRKGHHFFKIYFYNPAMHKRAIELLQSGSVLDQTFQPYEAHIPFILQFMIDYNIYGMSMINLKNVKHRHQTTVSQNERKSSYSSDEIVDFEEKEYLPFSVSRQSVCTLEMDVWASDILNREVIDKGIDLNPGIAAIWDEERTRRAQADLGGESQLTYPDSPARSQASKIKTDNDIYYQRRFLQRLASLESQADETALTPSSDSSSYPIPVPHNSNLLNASQLEIHAGPGETSVVSRFRNQHHLSDNLSFSLESQASFNNVSLDTSDIDVVNILANLAENQEGNRNEIDADSILGSQVSQQDFPLEPDEDAYNDEEEEVPDLNLTNLELDNLNFSSWEASQFNPEKLQHQTQKSTGSQIELVLESLNNPGPSSSTDNIPQLDGPIDDENAKPGPSEDPDVTIARQEFLECDYRRSHGGKRSVSVTPKKRKRITSSEDDDSRSPTKKRTKNQQQRTPRRSPSKRTSKLTSPSCPTRTYSPLSLEISGGQKTPKTPVTSPCASPSVSRSDRQRLRESFRRKAIFSPVKESNKEDEHVPVESESTKAPSKALKELFTPKKDKCEDKAPDSDDTLVEDSEESDGTLTSSPPPKPVIIDDSDSNPSHSQEKLSNLSNYNFPHNTLHPLSEEQKEEPVIPLEKSYSQIPGTGHKALNDELQTSFFAQVNRSRVKSKSPTPNRHQILENMEKYDLLNKDDANDSEKSEPGERIDDFTRQFFNQLQEASHKTLDEEVKSSFFAQMKYDSTKLFPPPPSRDEIMDHIEKFGLFNKEIANVSENSEPGQIDDYTKQFFSKIREMRQRELDEEGQPSSFAQINCGGLMPGILHSGWQQDLDSFKESLNLLKGDDSRNGVEEKVSATQNEQDHKSQTSSTTHDRAQEIHRSEIIPPNMQGFFKSIRDFEAPNHENLEPFFSNPEDTVGLPRYQSTVRPRLDSWYTPNFPKPPLSSEDLARMGLGVCYKDDETVMITPLILPPDREEVVARWKERNEAKKAEKEEEEKKKKDMDLQRGFLQRSEESSNSSTIVDQSLSISKLFKDNNHGSDGSKRFGISCGDIEGPSRATIVPADGNIGAKALASHQFLTIFCLEVHVITRPGLLPDPQLDPIAAIFYAIYNDVPPDWNKVKILDCGVIIIDPKRINSKPLNLNGINPDEQTLSYVATEEDSFNKLLSIVESCDPEMLIGWDIDVLSWGYLFQRASHLGKNLSGKISRIPATKSTWEQQRGDPSAPQTNIETLAEVRLPGRIVLEVWRIMKYEIAAYSYTYENVMYNVMNERIPRVSFDTLTQWWKSPLTQWRVIDNYTNKVIGIHRLLHHFDIINRTSEHARLYGVQFLEVFSRGSQFRVESMMLRIAKPLNYIPCSPSPQQRASMRAPESLPLIMEPESTMYVDPVIVLDFQSLYPSIIIAYNYCFSTCLGRVEHIGAPYPFEFGCTTLKVPKNLALKLQDKVNFAPCGVAFVKQEVRQGILPRMLTEILNTRFMVKKAIKDHPKDDRALQRALHSRQLGLKLIANVTYGYTAANFSGRMPCIEVGDSVVSKGKETLERAIKIVESTPKWGARVIYGDTDSLFILVKGKSREEAFKIGADIADTVTAANPKPVKLKFEKVLQPCILQTKKRYCGYMYENLNDKPVYLAKGIETVRRDGCPAVAKILEKSLKILFEKKDLSQVKQYVTRQLDKVLSGRASIQDLTFAKEFRGLRGYKAAACVPALELTKRMIQKDPRAVPRTGSRVPYVIVAGGPNEPLIRCVKSPMEVLMDPSLRPNATYYITKVIIPPLNRCLNLIGVDAYAWFMTMPHRQAAQRVQGAMMANSNRKQKTTISQYLCNISCPCCGQACDRGICNECIKNKTSTLINLHEKCRQYERIYSNIKTICESCIGVKDADSCISLDCPMFYRRIYAQRDNSQVSHLYDLINCMEHLT